MADEMKTNQHQRPACEYGLHWPNLRQDPNSFLAVLDLRVCSPMICNLISDLEVSVVFEERTLTVSTNPLTNLSYMDSWT